MFFVGKSLFFKKFFLNLLIIIQLSLSFSYINYYLSTKNGFYLNYDSTYRYETAEFVTIRSSTNNINDSVDWDYLYKNNSTLEWLPHHYETSRRIIYSYYNKTLSYFKRYLKKGDWLQDVNLSNYIPCVIIGNPSKINTTFKISNLEFKIVGSVSNSVYYINPNRSGQEKTAGEVFPKCDTGNKYGIICDYKYLTELIPSSFQANAMVYYDKNTYTECQSYINSISLITLSMEKIRYNTDNHYKNNKLYVFDYFAIAMFFMGIVSMCCMTILNLLSNTNLIEIFFNLGINKKQVNLMCLIYLLFFIIFFIIISLICGFIWKNFLDLTFIYVYKFNNFMTFMGYIILISIVNFYLFNKFFKYKNSL